ncbi:MAG: 16S rRNA processing protein RimM [Fibrobacteres bacterium]|nr:16S rRNA processing protein RimM [Fibrobacterota bacterium]
MSGLIEVGRILRPRGLKGEVKAECSTEERLVELKASGKVLFEKNGVQKELKIAEGYWQNGFAYIRFDEITTVEAAEEIRDGILLITQEELPPLPEGGFYQFELVGFELFTESGEAVGKVTDVIDYPTCDALEVSLKAGGHATIPMIKAVIKGVDKEKKRITVSRSALEELL